MQCICTQAVDAQVIKEDDVVQLQYCLVQCIFAQAVNAQITRDNDVVTSAVRKIGNRMVWSITCVLRL